MKISGRRPKAEVESVGGVKPTKVKRELTKKEKERKAKSQLITIALLVSLVFFIFLIILQNQIINNRELMDTLVAKKEVPLHTNITEKNFDEYFEVIEVDVESRADTCIAKKEDILEKTNIITIAKKELVTTSMLRNTSDYIGRLKNPVEMTFAVGSLDQIVGGHISDGDKIDVWRVSNRYVNNLYTTYNVEGPEVIEARAELIVGSLYVNKVYTSSGDVPEKGDEGEDGIGTMVSVLVEREDAAALQREFGVTEGVLRINVLRGVDGDEVYQLGDVVKHNQEAAEKAKESVNPNATVDKPNTDAEQGEFQDTNNADEGESQDNGDESTGDEDENAGGEDENEGGEDENVGGEEPVVDNINAPSIDEAISAGNDIINGQ